MIWKCGCCFPAFFPTFPNTKCRTIHPPLTAAQHISGASLNFPRRCSTTAKLRTAMSVTRCSGPRRRSLASSSRRRSGTASAKAPRASSTQASLGRGAPREPKSSHGSVEERGHFFYYLWCRGIFLDPSPWWETKILGFELFWFHLSSCYRRYTLLMLFDACCKYCCLLQSTAFTLRLCGISGCKSVVTRQYSSWLNKFNKYMFANVLVSLEGLRSAPAQCQKRFVVLRAQSFGCGICTAPQPWSMMMPITWQCGGRPCHQHGRQIKFKRMANGAQNRQGVGRLPASARGWLLGCNRWPLLCRIFNHLFLRVRVGGAGFLKGFLKSADVS